MAFTIAMLLLAAISTAFTILRWYQDRHKPLPQRLKEPVNRVLGLMDLFREKAAELGCVPDRAWALQRVKEEPDPASDPDASEPHQAEASVEQGTPEELKLRIHSGIDVAFTHTIAMSVVPSDAKRMIRAMQKFWDKTTDEQLVLLEQEYEALAR